MGTLYDISERYMNLLELAESEDENVQVMLEEALEQLDDELEKKAEGYAQVIAQLEHEERGYKELEEKYKEKKVRVQKNAQRIKENLQEQMERLGKEKIKTKEFDISLRNYKGSVEIKDQESIPEEFWTQPKVTEAKPDKNAMYKYLKRMQDNGEKVEWATIKENKGLDIK